MLLPQPEFLSLCVPKEKGTKEKGHPEASLSGHPALRVREAGPGFSAGPPARSKRRVPPWTRPLRGLIVPASPPPRGPEEQRASCAQKQRRVQSQAEPKQRETSSALLVIPAQAEIQ